MKNAVKKRATPAPGKEPVSDHDRIFEQGWNQLLSFVDGETLRAGLSKRDAATLYRELANECRERAGQLDHEANKDDEEAAEEGAEF